MSNLFLFPLLIIPVYLAIIIAVFYFVYTRVNKIIFLKEEHNDLLREIIKKLENK